MYRPHDVFDTPSDGTTLWRYTTWGRLCDVLARRALFFARAIAFDDPWEGSYPEHQFSLESTAKKFGHLVQDNPEVLTQMHNGQLGLKAAFEVTRLTSAVSCWHMAAGESDTHWRIYGHSGEGVAIRSTVGHLKQALEVYGERSVFIGAINYVDFATTLLPSGNGFWPIVHKRRAFVHDQEVRAVVWERETEPGGAPKPAFGEKGGYVAVNVPTLIQEVVVSPLAGPSFVETVREVIGRFDLACEVRRSTLLDPPSYRADPG